MKTIKALFFNIIGFLVSGSTEADPVIKQASLDEEAVKLYQSGQYDPAGQAGKGVSECTGNPPKPDSDYWAESQDNADLVYADPRLGAQAWTPYPLSPAFREEILGPDHSAQAQGSQRDLEMLHFGQALDARAEAQIKRPLAIWGRVLDPEYPDLVESMVCLGGLYLHKGLYSQAEQLFTRTLAIREQILGLTHPDVAESLCKLAAVYAATGRYDQAEPLYSRALAIYDDAKTMDSSHPLRRLIAENLALIRGFHSQNT
jgi:tetratricopeptide (TPR) repeat protein